MSRSKITNGAYANTAATPEEAARAYLRRNGELKNIGYEFGLKLHNQIKEATVERDREHERMQRQVDAFRDIAEMLESIGVDPKSVTSHYTAKHVRNKIAEMHQALPCGFEAAIKSARQQLDGVLSYIEATK